MIKTVLIPTDFSIESLNLFKYAAQEAKDENINVIFLHGVSLNFSITDLLFYSKKALVESLSNNDFRDACEIITNKFASRIHATRIEIFTGTRQRAFEQFIEANRVSEILIPKEYTFKFSDQRSFDPTPFIKKSSLPIKEVAWTRLTSVPEKNLLAELFLQS